MRIQLVFLGFILLTVSCNNPTAITPGSLTNIVTGISITNEISPGIISTWGTPDHGYSDPPTVAINSRNCDGLECEFVPSTFAFFTPYPNPSDGNLFLTFQLPKPTKVKLWLETAIWVGNTKVPYPPVINRPFQRIEMLDMELVQGSHVVRMNEKSMCTGGNLYPGFYRIFFETEEWLAWQDIYIIGAKGMNPPGLRNWIYYPPEKCFLDAMVNN